MLTADPIMTYFAPARAWLPSTWRSAGQLGYDPLPLAGAGVARRGAGQYQGSPDPEGSHQGRPSASGAWAWLERTWRGGMALGYETLPFATAAGAGEDLDAASDAFAEPMARYTQALQAAGGAVVLDARPGEGSGSGSGSLGDGAFARWHRPGRLFAGMLDPARNPAKVRL